MRRGQKFILGGLQYRVAYVNKSRAHCVAVVEQVVTIGGRTFKRRRHVATDISPDTCLEVLAELEKPKGGK